MNGPGEVLHDAAVLWALDGNYQRVIDAAVECLVADVESDAVNILAGSSASDPFSERVELVALALEDLGLPAVPADPDQLAREGVRILARSFEGDALTTDDLESWMNGSLTCESRVRVADALEERPRHDPSGS